MSAQGMAFQERVRPWMLKCFGEKISADTLERSDRFLEESLELVQACGYSKERAYALVDYVFARDVGEKGQEVGGVMVTLAALCLANAVSMDDEAERELARIIRPEIVEKIRAKQASKPTGSALPVPVVDGASDPIRERDRLFCEAIIATMDTSAPRLMCDVEKLLHHVNVRRPDRSPDVRKEYEDMKVARTRRIDDAGVAILRRWSRLHAALNRGGEIDGHVLDTLRQDTHKYLHATPEPETAT